MSTGDVRPATEARLIELLTVSPYRIYPYLPGAGYPGDMLYGLYHAMQETKSLHRVLYESERLDLETVLEYFSHACVFLILDYTGAVKGGVWFSNLKAYQGNIGVWYHPALQGDVGRQCTDHVCQYAFEMYHWRFIWGGTPWRQAAQHGLKIGFVWLATLPDALYLNGKWLPLYILRRENAPAPLQTSPQRGEEALGEGGKESRCLRRPGNLAYPTRLPPAAAPRLRP